MESFPYYSEKNYYFSKIELTVSKRTWKERLFTFPWKPLQKQKDCITFVNCVEKQNETE